MSSTDSQAIPPDWRGLVGDFVDRARKAVGSGEALSQELEKLGVLGDRGSRYSMSAISNWVKGRTMPPADVLLAVALVSEQSLDELLPGRGIGAQTDGEEVDGLKGELARLQAEMIHLYSRMGEPYDRKKQADQSLPKTGTHDK